MKDEYKSLQGTIKLWCFTKWENCDIICAEKSSIDTADVIAVVDDNKINLKVAKRLLSEYKLDIELVGSGSECIDKILDGKVYDLIFMDIMMPKMNGIETLNNLKNIVGFEMPVVALTADVISGMEEKYISQGFDDCLAKPIVEEELFYLLKKYLNIARTAESFLAFARSSHERYFSLNR